MSVRKWANRRALLAVVAVALCAGVCVNAAAAGSDCKPEEEQIANAIVGTTTTASDLINVARCTKNKTCCGPIKIFETTEGVMIQAYKHDSMRCGERAVLTNWFPTESMWSKPGRLILYGLTLAWSFLGIAIIADRFMVAIEVITSQEKVKKIKLSDGTVKEVTMLIWDENVANLTLMALGSSAPEILLAVGETVTQLGKPPVDGLGPATIVGSAAFNLLAISAICVAAIGNGEVRRIDDIGVFNITASFSLWAYVWMYLCLMDGVVTVAESIITILFLFILCGLSYGQGQKWKWCIKGGKATINPNQKIQIGNGNTTHAAYVSGMADGDEAQQLRLAQSDDNTQQPTVGDLRRKLAELMEKEGGDPSQLNPEILARDLAARHVDGKPKSRMYYRINATRGMAGGKRLGGKKEQKTPANPLDFENMDRDQILKTLHIPDSEKAKKEGYSLFEWNAPKYNVFENEKFVSLKVVRTGDTSSTGQVCYETSNGSALAGVDYAYSGGQLDFTANETEQIIKIEIVDDNEYEPDENFFVRLYIREQGTKHKCGSVSVTEVTIINDDDPGEVGFSDSKFMVAENCGEYKLQVTRKNGSDGAVLCRYKVTEETGKFTKDIEMEPVGEVYFGHMEMMAEIPIKIINHHSTKGSRDFSIEIEIDGFPESGARYLPIRKATLAIVTDLKLAKAVDNVTAEFQKHLENLSIGTASWRNQFAEAVTLHGENGEEPGGIDFFMHFLCIVWKVLFAFVPPTSYANGWACFVSSLMMIGGLTVFVGDIATTFGCLMGLTPTVTAITFVALGTSLPDTFASYEAAKDSDNADASIGNVTGSNSVNVFLGQGLPWLIASVYYASKGEEYKVSAGSLGFSLVVFLPCAILCIIIFYIRRAFFGGELGGPTIPKLVSASIMLLLWVLYVAISSLQSEGIIQGF